MGGRNWRMPAVAGAIVATAIGGRGPLLFPGGTQAASGADPRLAEMASPSPFRGLVYTG